MQISKLFVSFFMIIFFFSCDPVASAEYFLQNNSSVNLSVEIKYKSGDVGTTAVAPGETRQIGRDGGIGYVRIEESIQYLRLYDKDRTKIILELSPISETQWSHTHVGPYDDAYTFSVSDDKLNLTLFST